MKNLLVLIIGFVGLALFFIFSMPDLSNKVAEKFGFEELVINLRDTVNNIITKLPSREETYSGVSDVKDKVFDGLDYTKDKVDQVRIFVSGAEDKIDYIKDGYSEVKDFINTNSGNIKEVKDFIDTNSGTINEAKELINDVKELTSTGVTQ